MAKREIKNPAEGLFNTGDLQAAPFVPVAPISPAEGSSRLPEEIFVTVPQVKEARTQRKQIVIPPSVSIKADRKCKALGISLNEAVNQLIAKWVDAE